MYRLFFFIILLLIVLFKIDKWEEDIYVKNITPTICDKNFLYLIIYNENSPYERKMKSILERYVHCIPYVKTVFICFKHLDNTKYHFTGNTLYLNGKESYIPGILNKTVTALDLLTRQKKYDYVIRGNISTVINLDKVCNVLSKIKKTNIYTSSKFITSLNPLKPCASGTNIIMDHESMCFILRNKHKLNFNLIDDVAIGYLMNDNPGVNYIKLPGFKLNKFKHDPSQIMFYRNKSKDRMADCDKMEQFVDYLITQYGSTV